MISWLMNAYRSSDSHAKIGKSYKNSHPLSPNLTCKSGNTFLLLSAKTESKQKQKIIFFPQTFTFFGNIEYVRNETVKQFMQIWSEIQYTAPCENNFPK